MSASSSFRGGRDLILAAFFVFLIPAGCGDDPVAPVGGGGDGFDIHADDGYVGLVVDTRPMFKKGYAAFTVEVSFMDHGSRNAQLEVDPTTNLAILSIDTDDLSTDEQSAFAAGVSADVVVYDLAHAELGRVHDDGLVLDHSNRPLAIATDLPFVLTPVELRSDLPYLMQIEGKPNLVQILGTNGPNDPFRIDDLTQQLYLTPVAGKVNTFNGSCPAASVGSVWCPVSDGGTWLEFYDPTNDPYSVAADLVFEPDDDGWVKIRLDGTQEYLVWDDAIGGVGPCLQFTTGAPARFRFISDVIDWQIADRGTVFNQPIMPPAKLDFAYEGTLRNCSASTLEESIGRTESRTSTTTIGTSESLELFASASLSTTAKVGYSVTAKVGVDVKGIGEVGEEQTISGEVSVSASVTTSATTASGRTWSQSQSVTTEVSRVRSLTLPPYSAVEAYDAVKTIENVRIPFTQVLRISGTNRDTGQPLSATEIRSQMMFNFVGGVITALGADYIDISFRGEAAIDKLFQATTNVNELPGACD